MKENYLERPSASWKSLSGAFYEGELPGKAFREVEIVILVHFMKENYLERPSASWNGAFYEGELPGKAFRELEIL